MISPESALPIDKAQARITQHVDFSVNAILMPDSFACGSSQNPLVSEAAGYPRVCRLNVFLYSGISFLLSMLAVNPRLRETVGAMIFALVMAIALSAYLTANAPVTHDEFFALILANDSSLTHMLAALVDQVDAVPPGYYGTAWLWAQLFGSGEFSLRMLSGISFMGGLCLLFLMLRGSVFLSVALGVCVLTVLAATEIADYVAFIRFYGLFLLLAAAVLYLEAGRILHYRWSLLRLLSSIGCYGLLTLVHPYGVFYALALGIGACAEMLTRQLPRWYAPLLPMMLGMLTFLGWLPTMLSQANTYGQQLWIPAATGSAAIQWLGLGIPFGLIALAVVGLRLAAPNTARAKREPLPLVLAGSLIIVPWLIAVVFSKVFYPILWPRYLIVSSLGWAIIVAHIFQQQLDGHGVKTTVGRYLGWGLYGSALALGGTLFLSNQRVSVVGARLSPELETLASGSPVLVESSALFLTLRHYYPALEVYFAADREVAEESKLAWEANALSMLERVARHYPNYPVKTTVELAKETHPILIFDEPDWEWAERRLFDNPAWTTKQVMQETLWNWPVTVYVAEPTKPSTDDGIQP